MKPDLPSVEKEIATTFKMLENIEWLSCGMDFTERVLIRQYSPHRKTDDSCPTNRVSPDLRDCPLSEGEANPRNRRHKNPENKQWPGFW